MKKLSFIVILLVLAFQAKAQEEGHLLPATNIIGTEISVDYGNGNIESTTVNTIANAFDGDMNTFFASYERSLTWAGLDLGTPHVITKVSYCPRAGQPSRLVLGLFEGANKADFSDALPLCMITTKPPENEMTDQEVVCSKGFRYLRYVGPNNVRSNVAELAFYGYEGEGDNSRLNTVADLPIVSIHTENTAPIVSKEEYVPGYVSFISADGSKIHSDKLEIRGRGNASWDFPKKPYRLKLNKKTHVLGLPAEAKNWTLINNWGDKTLMRNILAFDLSKRLEMPYTPAGIPVNVFLNGEYQGCYQLCDQIDVRKNRVDIDEMTSEDNEMPNVAGGYLIEMDAYSYTEPKRFDSSRGIPVTVKYPDDEDITQPQEQKIASLFNQMEATLYSSSFADTSKGYRKHLDVQTFIRHFLVGEISGNTDTYWSVYMYKYRSDNRFYFGPVWDFDLAFENDLRIYPTNTKATHTSPDGTPLNWIYASDGSCANGVNTMVTRLLNDPQMMDDMKAVYAKYRNSGALDADSLVKVVEKYARQLDASQRLNFMRWDILNTLVHQNPTTYGSYEGEVKNVADYLRNRIVWMDKKLAYNQPTDPPTPPTPPTPPEEPPTLTIDEQYPDINVYGDRNEIHIENIPHLMQVEVFTTAGRLVYSGKVENRLSIAISQKGMFLVRLSEGGRGQTYKCVVR